MRLSSGKGIILSVFLSGCLHQGAIPEPSTNPGTPPISNRSATGNQSASNQIITEDQPPGNILYVREIYLEYPGYVAVHKLNENAGLGEMIGISHAIEGNKKQIDISLTQSVSHGEAVAVVMYRDDGDITFNSPEIDVPITDETGQVMMSKFVIDRSATHPLEQN
jgi:hypothetical protein